MANLKNENDFLDDIQEGLKADGTHPDFPVQKFFPGNDWRQIPWSELAFDLPALVVYEEKENSSNRVVGLIIALCHRVDGTRILVLSKLEGKTLCHSIEQSPSQFKPAYLLLKEHVPMAGLP